MHVPSLRTTIVAVALLAAAASNASPSGCSFQTQEALPIGILHVTPNCAWIGNDADPDNPDTGVSLVLPTTYALSGDQIVLGGGETGPHQGTPVATAGQRVRVSGASDGTSKGCLNGSDSTSVTVRTLTLIN